MATFDVVLKLRIDGTKKQIAERIVALIDEIQAKDEGFISIIDAVIEEPIPWSSWNRKP